MEDGDAMQKSEGRYGKEAMKVEGCVCTYEETQQQSERTLCRSQAGLPQFAYLSPQKKEKRNKRENKEQITNKRA